MEREKRRFKLALILLLQLHFFGVLGMHLTIMNEWLQMLTPFESFLSLTPANLILTAFILFLFHHEWNKSFYIFFLASFLIGFGVEVLGVKTGVIFGEYYYGDVLGFKLAEVPILIGVNWLVLAYSASIISTKISKNIFLSAAIGAFLMTALDWLIEPVAVALGFWIWEGGDIPLLNFIAWFIISFFICLLFQFLQFKKENKMAFWVIGVQALFFLTQQIIFSLA